MKVTMSAARLKGWLLLASLLVTISAARPGQAQVPVGTIEVCYKCDKVFHDSTRFDGPIFFIHNGSGTDITNGVLKIGPGGAPTDSFKVGTIAAGTTAAVAPGISDDGGSGHTFFRPLGGILDTSDSGPNSNNTQFRFTGSQGSNVVDSGVFTPAATQGPSLDGNVSSINFLGGPASAVTGDPDENCSLCFDNIVTNLNVPSISITQPMQNTSPILFDFAPGGPALTGAVDYRPSGTDPSGLFMKATLKVLPDSGTGWSNQFAFLTVNTPFSGKKCLHQEINGVFACLVTLFQCSHSLSGPFSGLTCPPVADPTSAEFIEETLRFENDLVFTSITGPGLIEGADNAQTCSPRPPCENLRDVFFSLVLEGPIVVKGHSSPASIFVPIYTP